MDKIIAKARGYDEETLDLVWDAIEPALPITYTQAEALLKQAFLVRGHANRSKVISLLNPLSFTRRVFIDREKHIVRAYSTVSFKQLSPMIHKARTLALWVYILRYQKIDRLQTIQYVQGGKGADVIHFNIAVEEEGRKEPDYRYYKILHAAPGNEQSVIEHVRYAEPAIRLITVTDDDEQYDLYKRKLPPRTYLAKVVFRESPVVYPELWFSRLGK